MTLCLAWKSNGIIHFASDSRATIGNSKYFDHCIKVNRVPFVIKGPTSANDKYEHEPYHGYLGIATAGNFLNAATIKDNLITALSSLQAIPGITDASMDGICKLVKKYFEFISRKLTYEIFQKGHSAFYLAGYCLVQERKRAFVFNFNKKAGQIHYDYKEILEDDGDIEFLGSGSTDAKSKFVSLIKTPPLEILREVIHDNNTKGVGGSIQFGKLKHIDFSIYGVVDYEVDEQEKKFANIIHLNGVKLMNSDFMIKEDQFHIQVPFVHPFEKQTNDLMKNGYMATDSI